MNNYLFISILFSLTLITGCKKEEGSSVEQLIDGTHLTIEELKNYLPDEYSTDVSLIYVNEAGEEKVLNTNYGESVTNRVQDGLSYTTDQFELSIYDNKDDFFQISIIGSTNYTPDNTIVKSINAMLMPFNDEGTIWATIGFENEAPLVNALDDFHKTFEVFNKVFTDVYINKSQQFPNAYSELDINSAVGVVAFRDGNNELWVFDRFEE